MRLLVNGYRDYLGIKCFTIEVGFKRPNRSWLSGALQAIDKEELGRDSVVPIWPCNINEVPADGENKIFRVSVVQQVVPNYYFGRVIEKYQSESQKPLMDAGENWRRQWFSEAWCCCRYHQLLVDVWLLGGNRCIFLLFLICRITGNQLLSLCPIANGKTGRLLRWSGVVYCWKQHLGALPL